MDKMVFDGIEVDATAAAKRLSDMVRFATVSNRENTEEGYIPFTGLIDYIKTAYPKVNEVAELTMIGGYSMLYRIKGSGDAKPILLMAHLDVVPVDADTIDEWEHAPFSGDIADDEVWGRGAIDCKSSVCSTLEAMEYLLQRGFVPKRDIYMTFGQDEEIMGMGGARKVAEHCRNLGLRFEYVIDEGGGFIDGDKYDAPGREFCSIGIYEKGYMDVRLTASAPGGHSSRPDKTTALSELAAAIVAVQSAQFSPSITPITRFRYEALLPYMQPGELRSIVEQMDSNPQQLIEYLDKSNEGNAMLRTTIAATQAWGSPAPNILPQKAQAVINFRLNPTETEQSIVEHLRRAIANENIQIDVVQSPHNSIISNIDTEAYRAIQRTVNEIIGDMPLIPSAMLGGTDSRNFDTMTDSVYRFGPFYGTQHLGHTVHANNERLPIKALAIGIAAYIRLID